MRAELETEKTKWQETIAPQQKELDALKAIREGRALEGLGALGVDYNKLTADVMAGGKAAGMGPSQIEEAIKAQLGPLQEELANYKKAEEERRQAAEQARLRAQDHAVIRQSLDADSSDRWELLKGLDTPIEEVYRYIELKWEEADRPVNESGIPQPTLTIPEAADRLEA